MTHPPVPPGDMGSGEQIGAGSPPPATLGTPVLAAACLPAPRRSRLDFASDPMGVQQSVLFRGDTRPPSVIFALGFTKATSSTPRVSGEKVKGVISTSKDAGMVRRKYTEIAGFLYAVSGFPGIDTRDFNKLDEVAGFFIPPECVIAAIGPVAAYDDENYLLVINNPRVQMNRNCRLPVQLLKDGRAALAALCRAPTNGD